MDTRILGLAGPSCSGKTTLAQALASELGRQTCSVISLDAYYRDLRHVSFSERCSRNFDVPDAIEDELLSFHLDELRNGRSISIPVYDFERHVRCPNLQLVEAAPWIVVEGLHALYWPHVRSHYDISVFLAVPDETGRMRRMVRDREERGRNDLEAGGQFDRHVAPMARRFVWPRQADADLVLDGTVAIELLVRKISGVFAARRRNNRNDRADGSPRQADKTMGVE